MKFIRFRVTDDALGKQMKMIFFERPKFETVGFFGRSETMEILYNIFGYFSERFPQRRTLLQSHVKE